MYSHGYDSNSLGPCRNGRCGSGNTSLRSSCAEWAGLPPLGPEVGFGHQVEGATARGEKVEEMALLGANLLVEPEAPGWGTRVTSCESARPSRRSKCSRNLGSGSNIRATESQLVPLKESGFSLRVRTADAEGG